MNRIENQKLIIMIHNPFYIKYVKTVIITRDTYHNETIYMSILHQTMILYSFSSFSKS